MTPSSSRAEPDLESVRRALGFRAVGLDLDQAFARWRAGGHNGDARALVDWILAEQASEAVTVTAVLPARFSAALSDPSTEATILETLASDDADPALTSSADSATETIATARARGNGAARASGLPGDAGRARYLILGEAGKGGMAVVHIARDLELMRKVALKRLAGGIAKHTEVQTRFLREVQISAQLDHPNIVPVYGLEVGADGLPAYAMKLVEGETLEAFLRQTREWYERGETPPDTHALPARLEHFLKVADAIAYAHDKGVIHRDLKPANVMIGRYHEIYVMDWGICRVLRLPDGDEAMAGLDDGEGDADSRTRMGAVVGTARYMAPEQALGETDRIGPASDQYSLGLMLFEIATLQGAYAGKTMVDVLGQASRAELRPVEHAFGTTVPDELAAIIGKATALDPAARYADVRALAADVRRFLRGDAVLARPDSTWQRAARMLARHRQAALLMLVGLVALAALGAAGLLYRHDRALEAASIRERAILALVDHAAGQGDVLQARFLELQGELDALTTAAALALQHTTADARERIYWVEDFRDPARQPPGLVAVEGSDDPVSFEFGAWRLAPGVTRAEVSATVGQLQHARPYQREMFDRARVLFGDADAAAEAPHASGVQAFVIGLAGGAAMHLPGRGSLPPIDAREAPWYTLARDAQRAVWGEPGIDPVASSLVVPLAQAIRGNEGETLGVAAMLLRLDTVIQNLLRDAEASGVRATLLLDREGRVIASSGLLHPQLAEDGSDVVTLEPFPDETLLAAVAERDAGYVESDVFGVANLLVFDRVQPMGWILVKVDEDLD